jgi:hypothetical protein
MTEIKTQTIEAPSRRRFMRVGLLTSAALAIANSPLIGTMAKTVDAATPDLLHDTLNGLLAFVVPGPDRYSLVQEASSTTPGGVDANVAEVLIQTLDRSAPFLPQFSAVVAGILNNLAELVHPAGSGQFASSFANLKYAEKVAVLEVMDATDSLKSLAGVLPAFVAYLVYSDAGAFDPAT